jgi:hypothetical protein
MAPELFNPVNYSFNLYAVPSLVTGVAVISLGFFVLVGERRSRVSFSFFIMTVTAAIWLLSYSIMYCAVQESIAHAWASMGQLGVAFIPAAVYHFTVDSLQIYSRHRSRVSFAWLVSAFFYATVLHGDNFLSGSHPELATLRADEKAGHRSRESQQSQRRIPGRHVP